jgi:hypothetical protein
LWLVEDSQFVLSPRSRDLCLFYLEFYSLIRAINRAPRRDVDGESKRNKRNVHITCKVRNADAVDYIADTSPGISI